MAERTIGRYIVKGMLGEGAMGSVYKGHDPNLERPVAIKTMRTGNLKDKRDYTEFKDRFFLEARANGRLNHPNIVSVYDSGLEENEPYLVMEFIRGRPLDDYVDQRFESRLDFYIQIMEQIASGLDYAHEEGVIHRDVKPGNMLVISKGKHPRLKIVDFGLAKLKDSKLTATGYFLGTPSYSSPEQVMGGRLDTTSDLFSFGTVAYEMLTGYLPFDGESLHSILYKIAHEEPELKLDIFADYLDVHALSGIFGTIFKKETKARFPTATEFVYELKALTSPLRSVEIPRELLKRRAGMRSTRRRRKQPEQQVEPTVVSAPPQTNEEQLIRETRQQFRMAYETHNMPSVRYCLGELKRLGTNVKEEERMLAKLTADLRRRREAERDKNRTHLIREVRGEFQMALKTRNTASVRYCLKELRKLDAETKNELDALTHLEQELLEEEKRNEEKLIMAKRIEAQKWEFQTKMDEADLASCQKLLITLMELGAEVEEEKQALDRLAEKANQEREQRQTWINKTREQFQKALEKKDKALGQQLITELELLLKVDASMEKAAFANLEAEEQANEGKKRHLEQTKVLKQEFVMALEDCDVGTCRSRIKDLKDLGMDVVEETKALARLRKKIAKDEADDLKTRLIQHARDEFRKALLKKNAAGCRYYLGELRQLINDVSSEERALASLASMVREEEENKLKEQVARKLRGEFSKAEKQRNLESCRYYLRELEQLNVITTTEKSVVAEMEINRKAEKDLQEKMIVQSRQKFFEAMDSGNPTQCEHYLNVLHELGAYINDEQETLAELKRKHIEGHSPQEKETVISKIRENFNQAYDSKDGDSCRVLLNELEDLAADVKRETSKLKTLS